MGYVAGRAAWVHLMMCWQTSGGRGIVLTGEIVLRVLSKKTLSLSGRSRRRRRRGRMHV